MERENTNTTMSVQTPLLQPNGTHQQNPDNHHHHNHNHHHHHHNDNNHNNHHQQQQQQQQRHEIEINIPAPVRVVVDDTLLTKTLDMLEFHLSFLGFNQSSYLSFVLSWVGFLLVGIALPALMIQFTNCSGCEKYQVNEYEYDVLTSQALLGAVSLICVSHNLRKRDLRGFLFVDKDNGHTSRFMNQYIKKIKGSYQLLLLSLLPCCILKAAHEIIRLIYEKNQPWWQAGLVASARVISWTYLSAICLVACILFHLACNLQVIHFNDYTKLLERESNMENLLVEHGRLRHCLSKISHRFRIYLLLVFLIVTSALFVTLVQTTSALEAITFINGGNFAVTSLVQAVETLLCLHAGTKISSKALAIGAAACRWHASATCRPYEGTPRSNSSDSVTRTMSHGTLTPNCSESDFESMDGSHLMVTRTQLAAVSSYNQRQSFVMYLQANPGGLTLYGWTVDRNLLTQIFFIELSLILFVLGQTIIFTTPS